MTSGKITITAAVYGYVCPKCLANQRELCLRVRKTKRDVPPELLDPHKERFAVWHAWEKSRQLSLDLPLDSVRTLPYKTVLPQTLESTE